MMAYSMSKTITAAAVPTLVEDGTIAPDDAIDRYLDANPYGPGITVRQLHSGSEIVAV
jgi:CubicO group peptidase (beta-lactamase class C family)